jgi:hypothetical protein
VLVGVARLINAWSLFREAVLFPARKAGFSSALTKEDGGGSFVGGYKSLVSLAFSFCLDHISVCGIPLSTWDTVLIYCDLRFLATNWHILGAHLDG